MEWVTREHPRTDRVACPWLIRMFIDRDAEIVYVPRDEVLAYAARTGATSFDAPGAAYTHRDGKCTFEVLVERFGLTTLMVTHNMEQALALGNRLIMMHEGRVVLDLDADQKSHMTVKGLLAEFEKVKGNALDDSLLQ